MRKFKFRRLLCNIFDGLLCYETIPFANLQIRLNANFLFHLSDIYLNFYILTLFNILSEVNAILLVLSVTKLLVKINNTVNKLLNTLTNELINQGTHLMNVMLNQQIIWSLNFNTLTADHEYSRHNTDNLPLPIQMQLSKKKQIYFAAFCCFFRIYIKFWTFWTKKLTS